MSEHIDSIKAELWKKMRNKEYREAFVSATLSTTIAAQIQTLRETRPDHPWTQKDLANKTGMSQARISVMEDPSYDKYTFSTLKRIAAAFDVAFIARFVPFSELVTWTSDLSPEKLGVLGFEYDSIAAQGQLNRANVGIKLPDVNQETVQRKSPIVASYALDDHNIVGIEDYTSKQYLQVQRGASILGATSA
jgi:transcriptional regulator with XRE-family HTH domain